MSGSPGAGGTREGGRLRGAPDVAGFAGVAGAGALQVAQRRPAGPAFNRGSRRPGCNQVCHQPWAVQLRRLSPAYRLEQFNAAHPYLDVRTGRGCPVLYLPGSRDFH